MNHGSHVLALLPDALMPVEDTLLYCFSSNALKEVAALLTYIIHFMIPLCPNLRQSGLPPFAYENQPSFFHVKNNFDV
jgi:hypothetical protein